MRGLIPWQQGNGGMMEDLRRQMDEMFDRVFRGGMEPTASRPLVNWTPRVDVEENEQELVVKADLPGVDLNDVEITVAEGALLLRGSREEEKEKKERNYHHVERFFGEFYRAIPLPATADVDKIEAETRKGVLTIHVPKSAAAQPKKITVKSNE